MIRIRKRVITLASIELSQYLGLTVYSTDPVIPPDHRAIGNVFLTDWWD